ncbi:MAG: exodeoxyribonuclease I, partial [Gammaproteobacteria bacterium]|nr:exodeoxyribonuclease I [Gammaproteobacteria bacterium]
PLCPHPTNKNGIIVYDLREDPERWASLSVEEIRKRIFTPRDELEEGVERIGLKTIHINKCPVVASPAVLPSQRAEQFGIDLDSCKSHWSYLQDNNELVSKVAEVFSEEMGQKEADPDYMIYSGGFFSDSDKNLMSMIRSTSAQDLARLDLPFRDARLGTMLQRYRARNFKDTLSAQELAEWNQFRHERLVSSEARASYEQGYAEAKAKAGDSSQDLFKSLDDYVAAITAIDATPE